jgi:hypothetical protein
MRVEIVRVELPRNVRLVEYQPGARGKEPARHLATIFLDFTINELTLCGLRARGPMWKHGFMEWIDARGVCGGCIERLCCAKRCYDLEGWLERREARIGGTDISAVLARMRTK